MPRVTVCIPAYRAEKYLPQALASVRAQSFADWELAVVEDGSQDGTETLVARFAREGPQPAHFRRLEINRGAGMARNTAIGLGEGELLAFLDADDLWEPDHLAATVARLDAAGSGIAHAGFVYFQEEGMDFREAGPGRALAMKPSPQAVEQLPFSLFRQSYPIAASAVVLRRELWERAGGFDPSLRHAEDLDLWLRCLRMGGALVYSGAVTCRCRQRAGEISAAQAVAKACGRARALNKQLNWDELPREARRNLVTEAWAEAAALAWREDPRGALVSFSNALKIEPRMAFHLWKLWIRLYMLATGK